MNHCLKFPNIYTAQKLLGELGLYADGEWNRSILDPIGILLAPTGETAEVEGQTVELTAPIPGWHCNLVVDELPEALQQYEVFPQNPQRVWA